MSALVKGVETPLAALWKWRERTGALVSPADMPTRHLFFTLRMIWNNRMPVHMRVGSVRLYDFRPHYTQQYFADAVLAIGTELLTRTDMTAEWKAQLDQIRTWSENLANLALPGAKP